MRGIRELTETPMKLGVNPAAEKLFILRALKRDFGFVGLFERDDGVSVGPLAEHFYSKNLPVPFIFVEKTVF